MSLSRGSRALLAIAIVVFGTPLLMAIYVEAYYVITGRYLTFGILGM